MEITFKTKILNQLTNYPFNTKFADVDTPLNTQTYRWKQTNFPIAINLSAYLFHRT